MMNSDSENDESCRPLESAKITSLDSLHEKSRKKYESVYQSFINWQSFMGINTFTESVLLVYFEELAVKYKSPSLWAHYSMLKSTLNINKNINIESYLALRAFLKKKSQGYQAKKAKTFTPFEINKFITEAPDHRYLATKVALIMGIMGACRAKELHNMTIKDVQDLGSAILVTVPNMKSKTIRKFTITDHFYNICKKYIDLRPTTPAPASFFLNYQKGKCTIQKIGINKFGAMGKQIATFLKLPNPEKYTGHTFRKSSATLVVGAAGGYITAFKRHGIWNPPSETEEQIDNENNELDNDMATCGAFGCKHNNLRDTCNFFRLPTDPKLRTDWLKSLRRDLESIPKVLFICSCHFRDGKVENGPELFTFKDIIGATLQPSTSLAKLRVENAAAEPSTSAVLDGNYTVQCATSDAPIDVGDSSCDELTDSEDPSSATRHKRPRHAPPKEMNTYCRLCLNAATKNQMVCLGDFHDLNYPSHTVQYKRNKILQTETYLRMIKMLMPNFDHNLVYNPIMCNECSSRLQMASDFIEQCMATQKLIQQYKDTYCPTEKMVSCEDVVQNKSDLPPASNPKRRKIIPASTPAPVSCPESNPIPDLVSIKTEEIEEEDEDKYEITPEDISNIKQEQEEKTHKKSFVKSEKSYNITRVSNMPSDEDPLVGLSQCYPTVPVQYSQPVELETFGGIMSNPAMVQNIPLNYPNS